VLVIHKLHPCNRWRSVKDAAHTSCW